MDYPQFLELVLSDEVERRDHKHLASNLIPPRRQLPAGLQSRQGKFFLPEPTALAPAVSAGNLQLFTIGGLP
jgi:hypothetical protein